MKPSNIVYGVDEKPPHWIALLLGVQHASLYFISLIFPVLIVREMNGTVEQADFMVSMSMIAGGIGAILQVLPRGPVGSGYLCPQLCGPSFLSASILAAKTGGLPLVFGMTVAAGITESLFSRVLRRLRFLFPAEVTGLIVALVGLTVVHLAVANFFGIGGTDAVTETEEILAAAATLAIMVGLNVWGKGKFRLFCVLIGMTAGYAIAYALGLFSPEDVAHITTEPPVANPFLKHPGWTFDFSLLIPVIIATLCSSLKSVGDITTCQKINDAEWKRPDMVNIEKGILADGLGCLAAGVLGGMGQSTSSSNVGLSLATGATSRIIALFVGGVLILLAFLPKFAAFFTVMPKPIVGATLIFSLSFMIVAGFQIIMTRMLDGRKIFIIGISIIFGLSVDMLPGVYADMHPWLQPVFSSSLAAGAVCAVVLNLVFRLGISQKASLELTPGVDTSRAIYGFLDERGRAWGARMEVINRAVAALTELYDTLCLRQLARGRVALAVRFDEYNLDVDIEYPGDAMAFATRPPHCEDILDDPAAQAALAGFLIGNFVDRINAAQKDGIQRVRFHFDH